MLDISQATSFLQSLGVKGSTASKAAEQAANSGSVTDPVNFLKQLQASLEELSSAASASASAAVVPDPQATSASTVYKSTQQTFAAEPSAAADKLPFKDLEEFRVWEKGLGSTFAPDYQSPDYLNMMGLARNGGDQEAFGRYAFFKNNPQFAADYEAIHSGALSTFPTDGSTLIKSDLSNMPEETASYYKENPTALRMAEGFSMDPTLYKMQLAGKLDIPYGTNTTEWLAQNQWTSDGVVSNNNRLTLAQAEYRGLDGNGADTYRLAKNDPVTGLMVDLDGKTYDPLTGQLSA